MTPPQLLALLLKVAQYWRAMAQCKEMGLPSSVSDDLTNSLLQLLSTDGEAQLLRLSVNDIDNILQLSNQSEVEPVAASLSHGSNPTTPRGEGPNVVFTSPVSPSSSMNLSNNSSMNNSPVPAFSTLDSFPLELIQQQSELRLKLDMEQFQQQQQWSNNNPVSPASHPRMIFPITTAQNLQMQQQQLQHTARQPSSHSTSPSSNNNVNNSNSSYSTAPNTPGPSHVANPTMYYNYHSCPTFSIPSSSRCTYTGNNLYNNDNNNNRSSTTPTTPTTVKYTLLPYTPPSPPTTTTPPKGDLNNTASSSSSPSSSPSSSSSPGGSIQHKFQTENNKKKENRVSQSGCLFQFKYNGIKRATMMKSEDFQQRKTKMINPKKQPPSS